MHVTSPIPHKKARIEIIPLIDIMFFLLASFMMVSLSQVHMKGIKVTLPTGASGETLAKVHQENPDAKVFVRGDRDTMHGNIIRVLDILRSQGFYKIAFEIKSQAAAGVPSAGTGQP